MGTRGAFGVIINETEKIGYNQYDSYPDGHGVENLGWLRESIADGELENLWALAEACRVVDDDVKPTAEDVKALKPFTNLGVSEGSTDDWYCLTRGTHGDIGEMLACGYICDYSEFPLDSVFCEWGYIVDFDRALFQVYEGFQKEPPTAGRWAGRPTAAEDEANYKQHVAWCKENGRDPWRPKVSEYKAISLMAEWPFDALPSDEQFLSYTGLLRARRVVENLDPRYLSDVKYVLEGIVKHDRTGEGQPYASEWAQVEEQARSRLGVAV